LAIGDLLKIGIRGNGPYGSQWSCGWTFLVDVQTDSNNDLQTDLHFLMPPLMNAVWIDALGRDCSIVASYVQPLTGGLKFSQHPYASPVFPSAFNGLSMGGNLALLALGRVLGEFADTGVRAARYYSGPIGGHCQDGGSISQSICAAIASATMAMQPIDTGSSLLVLSAFSAANSAHLPVRAVEVNDAISRS